MSQQQSTGMNLFGVLTVIFVVLKLVGVIGWSWWWVLAPLWMPLLFGICCMALALVLASAN